jgi:hypothetical protein
VKCKLYSDKKQLLIPKNNGELSLHSIENGEITKELIGHTGQASDVYLDSTNNIVVSVGTDSRILFQKESEDTNLIRMQDKAHMKKEITMVD